MKQGWSSSWKSSTQPRKQRKYRYNAPPHVLGNFMHAHLDKTLRQKYQTRSIRVRTGDKVKIMRGQFKKKEGKITRVNVKKGKVFVEGIERDKGDGSKSFYPINPSNVVIIELNDDKKRMTKLEEKKKTQTKASAPAKAEESKSSVKPEEKKTEKVKKE